MISCVQWIPRGQADPNPKRYELSKAERELLAHEPPEGDNGKGQDATEQHDNSDDDQKNHHVNDDNDVNDDNSEFMDVVPQIPKEEKHLLTATEIIASQKIDPSSLPKELRMDEYSDDDIEDDNNLTSSSLHGSSIGDLLIGNEDSGAMGIDENGQVEDIDVDESNVDESNDDESNDNESNDDESDDDLNDVPDTREYIPTDVKGLEAMNFGGYTGINDFEIGGDDDDNDSDVEDTNLKPDDALVIVAKTEEDFASLEICVYEEMNGNLFVHHDIPLPSFPLCLAHGTINSDGGAGNYVAVGTFDPSIEIWNADILNVLEPTVILGGQDTSAADAKWAKKFGMNNTPKSKFKSKTGSGLKEGSHTDAVMSLSWNQIHRQVIASGSADKTVKLWDITKADDAKGGVAATFTHHNDKVQSTAWHPTEGSILATGAYDKTVTILDARAPQSACKKVKIPADCEAIAWDPHHPHLLTAASEDGNVLCWDIRKFESSSKYWSFVAHEFGGCSDISYNAHIPGMMVSCAIDKTVAVWDTLNIGEHSDFQPIACGNKDMSVGKLYSVNFYPSSPWLLGCGGSGNQLALWDLSSETAFEKRFGARLSNISKPINKEVENTGNSEDFESIMAAADQIAEEVKQKTQSDNRKKKKNKAKKKAHRAR